MTNHPASLHRRDFLTKLAGAGTLALARPAFAADPPAVAPTPPKASWPKPTLHVYPDYGWLRGFNVVPSWGARIEDAWWFYDGAKMREEVALAKQVHANCIRLWMEFTAWFRDPDKITANFMDAVAAIAENGMKVMPCLFNRWHDARFDYGGTYTENLVTRWKQPLEDKKAYVRALVTPLAKDDRILVWDLCNEPRVTDLNSDPNKQEFAWLSEIAATVRDCGAQQPITIGSPDFVSFPQAVPQSPGAQQPITIRTPDDLANISAGTYAPLVDVLCAHLYSRTRADLETAIASYQKLQQKHGKPLLVNEALPGALDDLVRADVVRYYNELLSAAGFGWMGWALREGLAVSTRRDRYDSNGINGEGFHPFFTKDGKLRGGLEFLTEKPKQLPPWAK